MPDAKAAPRSLRSLTTSATLVIAVLAIASVTSLLILVNILQHTTADVAADVEGVRLFEEAEVDLLLLARTKDPVIRRDLGGKLERAFAEAKDYVTGAQSQLLEKARGRVDEYRRAARDPAKDASHDEAAAFAALQRLVDHTVAQARAARARAFQLGNAADVIGTATGLAVIGLAVGLVLWFRHRVLRPLYALAAAVKRFGSGDRGARAREGGPRELQDMSRRFNEMADAIATQRESQIAFLGGVAHDVRTPLSALRVAVDLMGPTEPLPPEPQIRHLIAVVSRQIDRLDRIAADFLDLSKIEAGKLELEVEEHDLRTLVRGAVELFDHARVRIDLAQPAGPLRVICDEVRISQAITNLVSNALKYSPASERVQITTTSSGDLAVIEVVDHGRGIPREDHQRIFEPFRRSGGHDAVPGTGLGLFNVKHFVEAHGGRIEVESVPSRGSTFRIYLPLAPAQASRPTPSPERRLTTSAGGMPPAGRASGRPSTRR